MKKYILILSLALSFAAQASRIDSDWSGRFARVDGRAATQASFVEAIGNGYTEAQLRQMTSEILASSNLDLGNRRISYEEILNSLTNMGYKPKTEFFDSGDDLISVRIEGSSPAGRTLEINGDYRNSRDTAFLLELARRLPSLRPQSSVVLKLTYSRTSPTLRESPSFETSKNNRDHDSDYLNEESYSRNRSEPRYEDLPNEYTNTNPQSWTIIGRIIELFLD